MTELTDMDMKTYYKYIPHNQKGKEKHEHKEKQNGRFGFWSSVWFW